jgi:hypothetical protein
MESGWSMNRTLTLIIAAGLLALAGCSGSSALPTSPLPGSTAACEQAMVQMLRSGLAAGSSAAPGSKPAACNGISNDELTKLGNQALGEVMPGALDSAIASAMPSFSLPTDGGTATMQPVPSLTGLTLAVADSIALDTGDYTTPEDANGSPVDASDPSNWTVCSQTPAAGTQTNSNGIILTVVDSATGQKCP